MTNRYQQGWSAGRATAEGIREVATGDDGTVDHDFLQGYAAGLDQEINGELYAEIETGRIQDDLAEMAAVENGTGVPTSREHMQRRLDQEINRRIQAERLQRLYGGEP